MQVHYPDSDGQPMAENDVIRELMIQSEAALRQHFRKRTDVYISANLFLYYKKGNPRRRVAPDLLVVLGVDGHRRPNYKIWEEGKAPDVVFEFTTASSRIADMGEKLGLYAALGIPEYYVFDPTGEYLQPRFRAFRLHGDVYRELPVDDRVSSPLLGLELRVEDTSLAFFGPHGRLVGDVVALTEELEHWRERAEHEAERARALEEEVRRLKAERDLR